MNKNTLRLYKKEDAEEIVNLFYDTVHAVNAKDYTPAQLAAWAPDTIDIDKWNESLSANYTVVVDRGGVITGFGDIDKSGYFDHLFVHKDHQGQGVAKLVAAAIEDYAIQRGMSSITVAASITAKPFFESRGYSVLRQQSVERNGEVLTNFFMEKAL